MKAASNCWANIGTQATIVAARTHRRSITGNTTGRKVTVVETLRLFRSFYQRGHSVGEVIQTVGLEEKRNARVGKLSGGQKQSGSQLHVHS